MPSMKRIKQDGVEYEFTPGVNGQTIVRGQRDASYDDFFKPPQSRSKVIATKDLPAEMPRITESAHNQLMAAGKKKR